VAGEGVGGVEGECGILELEREKKLVWVDEGVE
jgi:hypothetical protein